MRRISEAGALLVAALFMFGFFYIAAKDVEDSHIAGRQVPVSNTARQSSPPSNFLAERPAISPNTITGNESSEEVKKQVTYLTTEEVRSRCMDEYRQTGRIAIGENSYCGLYARVLDRQFAEIQPSPKYAEAAPAETMQSSRSSGSERAQPVANANVVDRAYLKKTCGEKFDDISWRDINEQRRRLEHRTNSMVREDVREIQELRCRISLIPHAE